MSTRWLTFKWKWRTQFAFGWTRIPMRSVTVHSLMIGPLEVGWVFVHKEYQHLVTD